MTVATDCSGSGSPEAALRALDAAVGLRTPKFLFACDITPASQRWLQGAFAPRHFLPDMCQRRFGEDGMRTHDIQGKPVFVPKGLLDVYVCGFPCQPFSAKGPRRHFEDDNVAPLFAMARTVACLRPRVVVAENVMGLRCSGALAQVKRLLAKICDYRIVVLDGLSNHQFGIPQHRPRIYLVMLRQDTVFPNSGVAIRKIVMMCQRTGAAVTPSWPAWLQSIGLPMEPAAPQEPAAPTEPCRCDFNTICHLHPCGCCLCSQTGAKRPPCKWRKSIRDAVRKASCQAAAAKILWRRRAARQDAML